MKTKLLFLAAILITTAHAKSDGTQADGVGSPEWFSWFDFAAGWTASWVIVGPMFIYWLTKRSAGNALG